MKNILAIQSHVVFGHAGNSAAEFPVQRLGVNVWALNTVQFSNHTQYGKWAGTAMSSDHLIDVVGGIEDIDQLRHCDAVLSGYLGSAGQGEAIISIVNQVKKANPKALYFCDPVMGHPEKGCIVAPGVTEFLVHKALPVSNIIAPNLLELEELQGKQRVNSVEQAVTAGRALINKGPDIVLVKHLSCAGEDPNCFEMVLVTADEAWHIARPLVDFGEKQPVGVGDLTSGLFLANILLGKSLVEALEDTAAAVYNVILETHRRGQYELQLVAAQDEIAHPSHYFKAKKIG